MVFLFVCFLPIGNVPSTVCTWGKLPPTLPLRYSGEWGPRWKERRAHFGLRVRKLTFQLSELSKMEWAASETVNLLSRVLKHKMTFRSFQLEGPSDSMNQNGAASFRPWVCWGLGCVTGMGSSWGFVQGPQPQSLESLHAHFHSQPSLLSVTGCTAHGQRQTVPDLLVKQSGESRASAELS